MGTHLIRFVTRMWKTMEEVLDFNPNAFLKEFPQDPLVEDVPEGECVLTDLEE